MTFNAQSKPITDLVAKFGVRSPRLDMMCVQSPAASLAMLAGVVITLVYSTAPLTIGILGDSGLSLVLVTAIAGMCLASLEVRRATPSLGQRTSTDAEQPPRTLYGVAHLLFVVFSLAGAPLWRLRICVHDGDGFTSLFLCDWTISQRLTEIGLPFRRSVRALVRAVFGRLAYASAIVYVGALQLELLTAGGARQGNTPADRLVLARTRAVLAAPVAQSAIVYLERLAAVLTGLLYFHRISLAN